MIITEQLIHYFLCWKGRKIDKLKRKEKRAAANMALGEKILLERLKMAEGGQEDGIRWGTRD